MANNEDTDAHIAHALMQAFTALFHDRDTGIAGFEGCVSLADARRQVDNNSPLSAEEISGKYFDGLRARLGEEAAANLSKLDSPPFKAMQILFAAVSSLALAGEFTRAVELKLRSHAENLDFMPGVPEGVKENLLASIEVVKYNIGYEEALKRVQDASPQVS